MKTSRLFISFFIILSSIFYIFGNIKLEKVYNYKTQEIKKQAKYKVSLKKEASLSLIKQETGTYIFSDEIKQKDPFDVIYFKIPNKRSFETYGYKVKLKVLANNKVYYPNIEDDGDERLLLDNYIYFDPIFLNKSINNFSYTLEFSDKSLLADNVVITTLDTKSFSYYLVYKARDTEAEDIGIIKRSERGAVEDYRYADSKYWKSYYEKLASQTGVLLTEAQKSQIEKTKKINEYLKQNFSEDYEAIEKITTENGHPLVWPIEKTRYVKSIVIHHTASEDVSKPSEEILRGIYYYHSLQKGWGDIGYHYIVGQDGKIYEGKAGGDYVVGAHILRNNRSTVSISVIGNYQNNYLTEKQQASINKLIGYLVKKYGIDLNKEMVYHKSCLADTKCVNPVIDLTGSSLIGHRDAGYTTCPGDNLYRLLRNFRESNIDLSSGNKLVLNEASMKVYEENKLKYARNNTQSLSLDSESNNQIEYEQSTSFSDNTNSFDKTNIIKIKLSYPESQNTISLKYLDKTYELEMKEGKLYNDGVLVEDKLQIGSLTGIVEITSWSRAPAWDTKKIYNDNKFRGIITLYAKDNKLVVVNELYLNDYMKGIAEISNDALPEKAKTILVLARSYARWYLSKDNRKFLGEYYDGSDDPDIFQKYLGYGIEQRNPNIARYVEETLDEVVTYSGKLIKPWYFNQSNGKTLSYFEYCLKNNPSKVDFCKKSQTINYPYLIGVDDPSGSGKTTLGHGVGLSGDGANYFAKLGRDYKKIIKYYYTGVDIQKLETASFYPIIEIEPKDVSVSNIFVDNSSLNSLQTNTINSTGEVVNFDTGTVISSEINSTGTLISSNTGTTIKSEITFTGGMKDFSTQSRGMKDFNHQTIKKSDTKIFSDIEPTNKYYTALKYFKDKKVLNGFSDGTFKPNNPITRAESLKMILVAFNYFPIVNKTSVFADVSTNSWENTYIQKAILINLISTKNKNFYPKREVSLVEALKMIVLLKRVDIDKYALKNYAIRDVSKKDWYYKYIVYAIENKLLNLDASKKANPTKSLTRGELVDMMYKLR